MTTRSSELAFGCCLSNFFKLANDKLPTLLKCAEKGAGVVSGAGTGAGTGDGAADGPGDGTGAGGPGDGTGAGTGDGT